MSSTTKPAKDNKPFHNTPKLVPRQTAASAARAARIATSKINTIPTKQSSSKNLANPIPNSIARSNNNLRIRFSSKPDLKHEVKQVKQMEDLVAADLVETVNHTSETGEDRYLIPDIQEDGQGQITYINTPGILEEINENKELGFTQNRPQSAKSLGSRPNTPQNSSASTPHTPHGLSRPNTPTTPRVVVTPTAMSRPNTPRRLAPKLTTPATCKSQAKEDQMKPPKEDDLKTVYISKKKKFNSMKKDLDLKQREILEIFDNLRDLQEQLNRDGISNCGDRHMNDLVVFNVADWTSEEIAQLCRDANHGIAVEDATDMISTALTIDENALADLLANAVNVPSCFADLCLQAFTARQELIDWVKELIDKSAIVVDDGSGECLERIANYNKHGLTMCDDLRIFKDKADEVMCTLCQLARRACRERSALFAVGETLVREIAQLRLNINDLHRQVELQGQQFKQSHISEQKDANTDLERQFEEEKAANAALKDKLANTESQLRQARGRINKMDKQLKEAETSIANLTGTVKVLEDQSRQREVQLEARARKLKESLKSGEFTTGQLTQERDLLNEEIVQLKERIDNMQAEKKTLITEHNNKIKEMKASMEEGNRTMQQEMEKKAAAEKALEESKNMIDELKLKIVRLENSLPNPDLPTEREMDIWAQLQATKDSLRSTEDEITALRREKIRFIETLTKITEMENKVGMQQKLAAELLSKEEIFGKMQMQIRELTKNVKLNEEKVSQYEQYVKHLHEHTRAVLDCQESAIGVSNQDLQHEVMNLKMNLLDAEHRNEELTELLNQKEQQLEQQDKTSRAQARVIKVNKQIASKADEIQELFATLENKQQQIHRLEKIVLALEEQQRRAQAQRTRHEEKIAALEHELAAGNRRERRFLFF